MTATWCHYPSQELVDMIGLEKISLELKRGEVGFLGYDNKLKIAGRASALCFKQEQLLKLDGYPIHGCLDLRERNAELLSVE
jgi:hypothetical protein